MKKLLLLLLFIPLGLFSQPKSDSIRIYSLDPNGVSLAEHEPKIWYYEYILDESYNYNESRENFSGTRENLLLGRIEKNFDANGTLREELFQAATYDLMGQSYLRLFNKWGKLKVEILLNKNGFKDGIETFWRDEYNDYKPDPPLWKKTEITYSNGNFVSSKTFAYKSDAVDYEVILLNEQTESILTVDLRFYLSKRYTNGNRGEYTHSRIYKNGVYTGLNGQGGKAGKDREWWANGNLQKEVNYQTIEKTKTSFKEGLKNNPTFYLNSQTNGFTREWYEGGELLSETYFEDDSFKSFKSFYASGNLKKEKNNFNSDDGKNENIVEKKYFANGNLKYSYSFVKIFDSAFIPYSGKNRVKLGSSKETNEYNEDGVLIFLETYKDNQLIARSKFDSIGTPIFKIENGITYYLGNKVFDRNNNTTKSYFKNGKLASLTQSNDTLSKETRWFISGEKEYEKVSNRINNTGNIKMWQNKKLVYDINLSNGSVIVNEENKIETNNFLNYSRESSGVIRSLSPEKSEEIEIFNSPYGEKIGEYNDYLNYFSSFQYGYEEYGIAYSDHINGRLKIGPSLWINDDVSFSSSLESTSYGNAWPPGLVLRSKPDKYSKKIIAFQGGSYDVSVIGWSWGAQEFINGYSKVRVDFYEEDPCEGGSVTKSWEGWAKVLGDFGNPNIDYPARGC